MLIKVQDIANIPKEVLIRTAGGTSSPSVGGQNRLEALSESASLRVCPSWMRAEVTVAYKQYRADHSASKKLLLSILRRNPPGHAQR